MSLKLNFFFWRGVQVGYLSEEFLFLIESWFSLFSCCFQNSLIVIPPRPKVNKHGQVTNPTWVTEYNFPATLSRCKYPKIADALHELQMNRGNVRNFAPEPLPPGAEELRNAGKSLCRRNFEVLDGVSLRSYINIV